MRPHRWKEHWTSSLSSPTRKEIDPQKLTQIRRYGVFAIPFIIESLEKRNSPELFAAFLIIIGEPYLYDNYLEKPSDFLPERDRSSPNVRGWAGRNERRIDKLAGLPQQIKASTSR